MVPAKGLIEVGSVPAVATGRRSRTTFSQLASWLGRQTRAPRVYLWLVAVSLVISGLTLMYPSTPSYDPWSWLIWGREIVHGSLALKDSGSSWKPLPMVFITVFALFGNAAPNLWLLVARAGYVLTILMSAHVAFRLTLTLTRQAVASAAHGADSGVDPDADPGADSSTRTTRTGAETASASLERAELLTAAPALLAAILVAVATALTHSFPGDALMGYSEAVALGLMLIAAERLADGHYRQAFALLLPAALDRPEIWVFWGPFGLWLMWRDRSTAKLVIGLGVLAIALWFVPTHLGGHSAVSQALTNHVSGSAVNSSFPFWTELHSVEWDLILSRAKAALILACVVAAWLLWRSWRREPGKGLGRLRTWPGANPYERAMLGMLALAAFGIGWFLVVAVETQVGFAGNPRYAVFGSAPLYIVGATGFGWAAAGLVRLVRRRRSGRRVGAGPLLIGTTVLMSAVALFVPGWVGHSLMSITSLRQELRFQARIRSQVQALVKDQGGAATVAKCGQVLAGNYEVPVVAWYLHIPPSEVAGSGYPIGAPATVFQVAPTTHTQPLPSNDEVGAWIDGGASYQITQTDPVTLYSECHR